MAESRQPGIREVALLAIAVVVTVLVAAGVTALLPRDGQAVVFHTPLLIVVLIGGTGLRAVADPAPPGARSGRLTGPRARPRRDRDLRRLADESWDLLIVGGGIVGRGGAARRGVARAQGRARRAGRHRGRDELPVEPPDPRRPALPAPAGRPARPRGAPRAGPPPRARPAPDPARGVPVPALRAAGRDPRLLLDRHDDVRRPGLGALRGTPPRPVDGARRSSTRRTWSRTASAGRSCTTTRWRTTRGTRSRSCGRRSPMATARPSRSPGCARPGRATTGVGSRAPPVTDRRVRRCLRGPRGRRPRRDRRLGCLARPAVRRPDRSGVLPARGSHLVIERARIPARGGMTLQVPGRVAFLVPWPRHWVIGTTDQPYRGPIDRVAASNEEVDELLGTLNGALDLTITRDDLVGHVRGAAAAHRAVRCRLVGQGVARAPGRRRGARAGPRQRRQVHDLPGDGPRRGRRRAGRRRASPAEPTAELPIVGAAPRPELDAMAARLARDEGVEPDAGARARRPPRDRGPGRRSPAAASWTSSGPSSTGFPFLEAEVGVGRRARAGAVARRPARPPVPAGPGASRPRRGDRAAGGGDRRRRAGLGRGRARPREVRDYLERAHREYDVPAPA